MPDTLTPLHLALDHHQAGRLASAEAGYRRIIEDNPGHVEALHYLGVLLHQRGEHRGAAEYLDRALVLSPHYAACWSNRGLVAAALADSAFAVTCQRRALAIDPSFANAHNNLGVALQKLGRDDEAIDAYQQAIAHQPGFIDARTNLGASLAKLKRHEEALAVHREALALDPANSGAHFGVGNALRELGRLDDAIGSLQRAVELAPAHFESRVNLGTTLGLRGRFTEAEAQYRHALTLRDDPQIHVCVGAALGAQGRFDEEAPHYRHALTLDPDHADAQHNLALMHLRRGEFEQGWTLYETRWRASKYTRIEMPGIAEWAGEPLGGRKLLLVGEQGHGDQLQFVRYAAVLERMGASVDVLVPGNIAELVGGVRGVRRVLVEKPRHGYDFWTPMMSVPYRVAGIEPGVPAEVPYLRVSGARLRDWPQRVADLGEGRRRVGVVWAGSPTFANDRFRSMPLAALGASCRRAGHRVVFAAKGTGARATRRRGARAARPHRTNPGFRGYRRAHRTTRSRHHRGYVGCASGGRARQAGVGAAAGELRLALDARSRRQPVVSDHASFQADVAGRLEHGGGGGQDGADVRWSLTAATCRRPITPSPPEPPARRPYHA